MTFIKSLFSLFYPRVCTTCENLLLENEAVICTFCRHDLPLTHYNNYSKNKVKEIFYGRIPLEKATSLLFFRKKSKTKKLIHQLKYKGNQKIGTFLGRWMGELIKESNQLNDIDFIIPVPLHYKKLKERGYNQVDYFGNELSKYLNTPYKKGILIRTFSSETQTFKQRFERFKNSNTKFTLTDQNLFINKHILLIDDVITTGATLEACAKEILKIKNTKISIVTMAFTE